MVTSSDTQSNDAQVAAQLVHNLFNNDPNKSEIVLKIVNQSDCDFDFKIEGQKNYETKVPANGYVYIALLKGSYKLSTMVCDALYERTREFDDDSIIKLGAPRKPARENN